MAGRPPKEGLDYFELDCRLDTKIRLIQAEYGLKGLAVVVLLYQRIYGERGYYMDWNNDQLLLFMSENGVAGGDKNLIQDIVSACVKRDIFSKEIFDRYGVLTSHGIQKRYLRATAKRCGNFFLKKEYLLLSDGKNSISSVNNPISDVDNSISSVRNSQRREEKKREDKSREDKSSTNESCSLNNKPQLSGNKGVYDARTRKKPGGGNPPENAGGQPKSRYGEYGHVLMTDWERDRLFNDFGEKETLEAVRFLDRYMERKDYESNSHYLCIREWVLDAVRERKERRQGGVAREGGIDWSKV